MGPRGCSGRPNGEEGGVAQPGQSVSGALFEKRLRGCAMTEEVVGRNLGIVPTDLAPDVLNPGSQIVFVIRTAGRIAESIDGVVVGPAGQDLGFDRTGLADARTANDQPASEPLGCAHKHGPTGELDELPPAERKVDDSMILSDSALVHTPSLALMVAEQKKNTKKLLFLLFVIDQDKKEWLAWKEDRWVADMPVITDTTFSCTGTGNLDADGTRAIQDLFERSFGSAA